MTNPLIITFLISLVTTSLFAQLSEEEVGQFHQYIEPEVSRELCIAAGKANYNNALEAVFKYKELYTALALSQTESITAYAISKGYNRQKEHELGQQNVVFIREHGAQLLAESCPVFKYYLKQFKKGTLKGLPDEKEPSAYEKMAIESGNNKTKHHYYLIAGVLYEKEKAVLEAENSYKSAISIFGNGHANSAACEVLYYSLVLKKK